MKRFFKALALVLALALVIGTIPVSAAETTGASTFEMIKGKYEWRIYIGKAHGVKIDENGQTTEDTTKDRFKLTNKVVGFNPDTMDLRLESANTDIATVSSKKDKVYAKSIGTAKVTINIVDKKSKEGIGKLNIDVIVKKNAESVPVIIADPEGNTPEKYGVNVPYTFTLTRRELEDVNENGKLDLVDTDKRKLICVDADGNTVESVMIEQPDTKKPIYTVTFTAAGDFTLKAQCYQSASWPVILKETEINCTAGYTALDVRQKTLDTVAVTFDTKVAGLKPENFAAYYRVYDTKAQKDVDVLFSEVYENGVRADAKDENIANITWYSRFEYGVTYYIAYGKNADGTPNFIGSFTAATVTESSVKRIEIEEGQIFSKGDPDKLAYHFYDENDVDITAADELYNGMDPFFEFTSLPEDDFNSNVEYQGINDVHIMLDVLGTYEVQCTYTFFDNNSIEQKVVGKQKVKCEKVAWDRGAVECYLDGPGTFGNYSHLGSYYLDSNYYYHSDWASSRWAMGDGDAYLEIAVPYTKKGHTVYEGFARPGFAGVVDVAELYEMEGPKEFESYKVQTSNENIVIVADDQNVDGKVRLTANQAGSCLLIIKGVYTDDNFNEVEKAIGTYKVTVVAERKASAFSVSKSTYQNANMINLQYMYDWADYSVKLADQYGDTLPLDEYGTYSVKQVGTKTDAVVTNFGGYPIASVEEGLVDLTAGTLRLSPTSFDETTVIPYKKYAVRFDFKFTGKDGKELKPSPSVAQVVVGNEDAAIKYEMIMDGAASLDTAVYADTGIDRRTLGLIGKTKNGFHFYGPSYELNGDTDAMDSDNLWFEGIKLNDLEWVADCEKGNAAVNTPVITGTATRFVYTITKDNKAITAATDINAEATNNGQNNFLPDADRFQAAFKGVSGSAVKLASGTYRITAYKLTKSANFAGSTTKFKVHSDKISTITLTVTDSQSKPVVNKLFEGERIADVTSVAGIDEAFALTLKHTKWSWTPMMNIMNDAAYPHIYNFNLDKDLTTAYITNVEVTILNDTIGNVVVKSAVDKIVKQKKV